MNTADALRIGLLLPSRELMLDGPPDARRLAVIAADAEHRGYDSVWVGDSPLARPRLDPMVALGAVAAATESVTIGTAAMLAVLRHPVAAAWQIASVDQIARGRLVLGLGAGAGLPATRAELAAFGVPFERRVARMLEVVALWRSLWSGVRSGDEHAVGSDRWSADALSTLPRPHRQAGPPLWLAANGTRTRRLAGEHFDGWLPYPPAAAGYSSGWDEVAEAAAHTDRDVTPALYATVLIDDDVDAARRSVDDYGRAYYGAPLELMETVQAFRIGDTATVVAALAEYVAAGARHLVLRVGSLHPERHLDELDEVAAGLRRQFA